MKLSPWSLADPGGAAGAHPLPGSNSFIFAHVFTEKHPRWRSVPPPPTARRPPQREILDPPLMVHPPDLGVILIFNKMFIMKIV